MAVTDGRTDGTSQAAEPAPTPRRIRDLDALRGFALLGILLVNIQTMAGLYAGIGGVPPSSTADRAAAWLVTALASTKFYLLFSFLFGYSFTLQACAAEREHAGFVPRHLRRLLGLLLLGCVHAVLLYPGDILMTYAVLGLVLIPASRVTPRTAARTGCALLAVLVAYLLAIGVLMLFTQPPGYVGGQVAEAARTIAAYRGGPASVVHANLERLPETLAGALLLAADIAAAMLFGLAAGKARLLHGVPPQRRRTVRLAWWGLAVGLAGSVFMACCQNGPLDARWSFVGMAAGALTAPALTASYGCGLLLLLRMPYGKWLGGALAPAGRMALTNYLFQSLVTAFVFTGYGLALYGRLPATAVLAGALVLYAAQLALSARLMRRFRYGPAEWLLRAVTLARVPGRPALPALARAHGDGTGGASAPR